jgi:hypothetical protein
MRMRWRTTVLAVATCTGLWAAGACGGRAEGEAGETGEALTSDEGRESSDRRSRTGNIYALTNDELNGVVRYSRATWVNLPMACRPR